MAKKFAEITGIHKIFDTATLSTGPYAGTTIYTVMSITDSELQKNIDENTIVFVTADNDDEGKMIGPNNYKISKDDCFIVAQNKVYATFGKVNVSDVMGPTGENGISPTIGQNGNWFIGSEDTGVKAQGPQGIQGPTGPAGTSVSMPIGSIMMFAGDTAPDGWLFCRGQRILVVSATNTCTDEYKEFQELASIIGSIYGTASEGGKDVFGNTVSDLSSGSGTHYIKLPDFSTRFPYGTDYNFNLGNTGGTSSVEVPVPYHTHRVNQINANATEGGINNIAGGCGLYTEGDGYPDIDRYTYGPIVNGVEMSSSTAQSSINITPPYLYINFIIKYK